MPIVSVDEQTQNVRAAQEGQGHQKCQAVQAEGVWSNRHTYLNPIVCLTHLTAGVGQGAHQGVWPPPPPPPHACMCQISDVQLSDPQPDLRPQTHELAVKNASGKRTGKAARKEARAAQRAAAAAERAAAGRRLNIAHFNESMYSIWHVPAGNCARRSRPRPPQVETSGSTLLHRPILLAYGIDDTYHQVDLLHEEGSESCSTCGRRSPLLITNTDV